MASVCLGAADKPKEAGLSELCSFLKQLDAPRH